MHERLFGVIIALATLLILSLADRARSAQVANPLAPLAGSWNGSGTARFEGGQGERLSCRGYYTIRGSGAGFGLALRCASASTSIELRSLLDHKDGRITGSWEERTFNASGDVTGQVSDGALKLAINGGGFTGTMAVTFTGSSQSVSITASGSGFKTANITLRRY